MSSPSVQKKPKITTAFVHTFWDVFDHLGFWIGANFICFLSCLTVVLAPITLTGLLVAQKKIIDKRPISVKEFIADCRELAPRSFVLGLIQFGLMGIGFFNIYIYLQWGGDRPVFFPCLPFSCIPYYQYILFCVLLVSHGPFGSYGIETWFFYRDQATWFYRFLFCG